MKKGRSVLAVLAFLLLISNGSDSRVFAGAKPDVCNDHIAYNYQFTTLVSESKFHDALAIQNEVLANGKDTAKKMALVLKGQYLPRALPSAKVDLLLQKISSMFPLNERIVTASECVKAYPDFEYAHYQLSVAYWMNQQDSEAEKEALKAVALSPVNPLILQCLGSIYIYQGKEKKARRVMEKLRILKPKDTTAIAFFEEMDKPTGKLSNLVVDRSTFREIGKDESPRGQGK